MRRDFGLSTTKVLFLAPVAFGCSKALRDNTIVTAYIKNRIEFQHFKMWVFWKQYRLLKRWCVMQVCCYLSCNVVGSLDQIYWNLMWSLFLNKNVQMLHWRKEMYKQIFCTSTFTFWDIHLLNILHNYCDSHKILNFPHTLNVSNQFSNLSFVFQEKPSQKCLWSKAVVQCLSGCNHQKCSSIPTLLQHICRTTMSVSLKRIQHSNDVENPT